MSRLNVSITLDPLSVNQLIARGNDDEPYQPGIDARQAENNGICSIDVVKLSSRDGQLNKALDFIQLSINVHFDKQVSPAEADSADKMNSDKRPETFVEICNENGRTQSEFQPNRTLEQTQAMKRLTGFLKPIAYEHGNGCRMSLWKRVLSYRYNGTLLKSLLKSVHGTLDTPLKDVSKHLDNGEESRLAIWKKAMRSRLLQFLQNVTLSMMLFSALGMAERLNLSNSIHANSPVITTGLFLYLLCSFIGLMARSASIPCNLRFYLARASR